MRKRNALVGIFSFMVVAAVFWACTQETAVSGPNFIFKPAPKQGLAAKVGGVEVTEAELTKGIEAEIFEAESKVFEIKMNKLRALVLEKLMEKDPRKKGMNNDEFLDKFIAKVGKPGKADVDKFIKERQIPQENVNDELKGRVEQFLTMESKRKTIEKWMGEQTAKAPVEVYMVKPSRPVFDINLGDSPIVGKADAKVTVVEFTDFQCPFCSRAHATVTQLKKKYGDKVKFVIKNFPLPFHQDAKLAAQASLCANEQGIKLMEKMNDAMFAEQSKLNKDGLLEMAKKSGIKADQFSTCLDSQKYAAKIDADVADGNKVGVNSTPTYFINGKMINGAQPVEVFSDLIDEELKK
ncbi:MAG: DsbA family protein [Pseudomonadota bacterium]